MGTKGFWRRPYSTTRQERNLREKYAWGGMNFVEYERTYRKLMKRGLICRNGKVIT